MNLPGRVIKDAALFPSRFPAPALLPLRISCVKAVTSGEEAQEGPYHNKGDSSEGE